MQGKYILPYLESHPTALGLLLTEGTIPPSILASLPAFALRLYNGNINDSIIKKSVQRKLDNEKEGWDPLASFTLTGNQSETASTRPREPIAFNKYHLQSAKEKLEQASEK